MSTPEYQQPEAKSSVKISCTAKGELQPEVKVVEGTTAEEIERLRILAVGEYLAAHRTIREGRAS